jgi:hypothetical protein
VFGRRSNKYRRFNEEYKSKIHEKGIKRVFINIRLRYGLKGREEKNENVKLMGFFFFFFHSLLLLVVFFPACLSKQGLRQMAITVSLTPVVRAKETEQLVELCWCE